VGLFGDSCFFNPNCLFALSITASMPSRLWLLNIAVFAAFACASGDVAEPDKPDQELVKATLSLTTAELQAIADRDPEGPAAEALRQGAADAAAHGLDTSLDMSIESYAYGSSGSYYCYYYGYYYCGYTSYRPYCCSSTCCSYGYYHCNSYGSCSYGYSFYDDDDGYYYRYCGSTYCGYLNYQPNCCGDTCCSSGYNYCASYDTCVYSSYYSDDFTGFDDDDDGNYYNWICSGSYCYYQGGYSTKPNGCCGSTCCYGDDYCCSSDGYTCENCNDISSSVVATVGAVIGGVIGGIVFLCFAIGFVVWWACYRTARLAAKVSNQSAAQIAVAAYPAATTASVGVQQYSSVPTYYGNPPQGGVQMVGVPQGYPQGGVQMMGGPQGYQPAQGYQPTQGYQPAQGYAPAGVQMGYAQVATGTTGAAGGKQ
jgi:hypothetical protein